MLIEKRITINRLGLVSRGTIRIRTAKIGAQIETTSSLGLSHARYPSRNAPIAGPYQKSAASGITPAYCRIIPIAIPAKEMIGIAIAISRCRPARGHRSFSVPCQIYRFIYGPREDDNFFR